jgi:hypothetical protein
MFAIAFALLFAHFVLKHSIVMTYIMRDPQNTIFNSYLMIIYFLQIILMLHVM